eukprot:scaffold155341_cov24-Tisochrysis_lutea.AAC.1
MQEKPLPAGFDEGCRHIRVVHTTSNGASRVHAFMHSPHESMVIIKLHSNLGDHILKQVVTPSYHAA